MSELIDTHSYKFRLFIGSFVIAAGIGLLAILLSTAGSADVKLLQNNASASASGLGNNDNPNVVTGGIGRSADSLGQAISNIEHALTSSMGRAASSTLQAGQNFGKAAARSSSFAAAKSYKDVSGFAVVLGEGMLFAATTPFHLVGFAANALTSSSIVRTETAADVPVIDTQLAELYPYYDSHDHAHAAAPAVLPGGDAVAWPMQGRITTLFGVPHRPFQVTHTGLDISSGQRSGVTPIKPFRSGRVIKVVHSNRGLGNHVVIDHGEGLTSVYAHFYSISVSEEQTVDTDTVLGLEGSTGVSTGPHLHLEIRMNGHPVDPLEYLGSQP